MAWRRVSHLFRALLSESGCPTGEDRPRANRVVNNHWGILLTGGPVGNEVAENQIHGHLRAGIATLAAATSGNVIAQNDSRGNGLGNVAPSTTFDLFDEPPVNNIWERNKGTANF